MSSETDTTVAAHYTTGALFERIIAALEAAGIKPDAATASDLMAGDQFHTGGLASTEHLVRQLSVTAETKILDVGCGIGGTSRFLADRTGAHVTGVDLTPEFIETSAALGAMVGLSGRTEYHVGSALNMPVADDAFDLAVMMHVGMNIADKETLFAEVARTLRPGGTFALFEVMRGPEVTDLLFPLPWSSVAETSFVAPPGAYVAYAESAGFRLNRETDRSAFAADFFHEMRRRIETEGPSPFGIGLMMGDTAPEKISNYVKNLGAGRVRPTEMIFDLTS
ncbi:MAG: methyltransferase domain-containing protein [Pseudomonadota bacterium]